MAITIHCGDALSILRNFPENSAHCAVTSPPYWGLRDYGVKGQIGLEKTPGAYVEKMVEVFREVRRVLRKDGTLWLNLGDSYAGSWGAQSRGSYTPGTLTNAMLPERQLSARQIKAHPHFEGGTGSLKNTPGLKQKDLVGIPWRVAFALQADGWYLRSDIIWSKPNPMPESVTDRPTRSHEYLFLLSKSKRYFYDAEAIKEPGVYAAPNSPESIKSPYGQGFTRRAQAKPAGWATGKDHSAIGWATEKNQGRKDKQRGHSRRHVGFNDRWDHMTKEEQTSVMRNKRSVWTISTQPFSEAHFATFPVALVEPCIKAGCPGGGVVLDPFGGAGTTGLVADRIGRHAVLIELNPDYVAMAKRRIEKDAGMFSRVEVAA